MHTSSASIRAMNGADAKAIASFNEAARPLFGRDITRTLASAARSATAAPVPSVLPSSTMMSSSAAVLPLSTLDAARESSLPRCRQAAIRSGQAKSHRRQRPRITAKMKRAFPNR
jgi:hypothetical protein